MRQDQSPPSFASPAEARAFFIDASVWHGALDRSRAILAAWPAIAALDIHTASLLGDDAQVRSFLAADPASAAAKSAPLGWDALTHLCFSRYLRLEPERSEAFERAARALLEAGASANTGFFDHSHRPEPEWESALYGAAGVAHHPGLTRLLLDYGADPNDEEVPYHAPESYDNRALAVLLDSGRLNADSLATMLLRKADWHDGDGLTLVLRAGADPNRMTRWHHTALHQAVRRDNGAPNIEVLLDHGADPTLPNLADRRSAVAIAARRGRRDLLDLFEKRGVRFDPEGVDRLIAACARTDLAGVRAIAAREPALVQELIWEGGRLLAEFAGTGNTDGVAALLDLGIPPDALYDGDGYFGIAPGSTALHVAAWKARPETVALLVARGAPLDARDGHGRTALALAVKACVDSYWVSRRTPDSVRTLLAAGASVDGTAYPSGYADVDALLAPYFGSTSKR